MKRVVGDWEGSMASGRLEGQLPRMSSAVSMQPCIGCMLGCSPDGSWGRELMELVGEDRASSLSLSYLHARAAVSPAQA